MNVFDMPKNDLITTEQLAEALNCSKHTIYRRVRSGELPMPTNVGSSKHLFRAGTVQEHIRKTKKKFLESCAANLLRS